MKPMFRQNNREHVRKFSKIEKKRRRARVLGSLGAFLQKFFKRALFFKSEGTAGPGALMDTL